MSSQKVTVNYFRVHCPSDLPYLCHFGSEGSYFHCHADFYEFCLIASGSYRHIYRGKESTYDIGQLLFFSPGESHALIENSSTSHHYSFIIEESYFRQYVERHMDNAEQILSTHYVIKKLSGTEFMYLTHLASLIVRSVSIERLPIANHFLSNLLFYSFAEVPDAINNSIHSYAIDLLRVLDSYRELNANVTDFYKVYPVSSTTLARDFKELTGQTIVQYQNLKRMEYAARLLEEENYSITIIANMLKISSLGYFSKQFKKQYGMTPKQYQLLHRKNEKKK